MSARLLRSSAVILVTSLSALLWAGAPAQAQPGSASFFAAPNPVLFGNVAVGSTSTATTVTVTSTGTAALVLGSVSILGADAAEFSLGTDTCSNATVIPPSSCSFDVTYSPTTSGPASASAAFSDNAPGSPHTISLAGTGVAPVFSASPDPADFGDIAVGATSASSTITITNNGTADLVFGASAVSLSGADAAAFALGTDTCSSSTVTPGNTCTVDATFAPTATGSASASVSFSDNAAGSPQSVALTGTGVEAGFSASPDPVGFGDVTVGSTSTSSTITVTNTGTADLVFAAGAVTLTGTDAAAFALDTDTCSSATVTPGNTCTVDVIFSPTATGSASASAAFADNAPGSPHSVALTGTGVEAGFSASPDPVGFGDITVGSTSTSSTITVTNTGTADLAFAAGAVTLTGTDAAAFALGTDTCSSATVSPTNTCTVDVTFSPTTTGAASASATFADNAPGSPHSVALTGTGVQAGFSASPDPVGFGDITVGSTSSGSTITVTNTGTADLVFGAGAVTLTGTDAAAFALGTDTCSSATVTPTNTCTVDVTFSPTATGAAAAAVAFADNAPGSPQDVNLTGTGVAAQYTLTYHGNGSTGGTVPDAPTLYAQGATVTVAGNTGTLSLTGYTFAGWNTNSNGSGTAYSPGATFAMPGTDTTLYAQWTQLPLHTVTFAANGGTGTMAPQASRLPAALHANAFTRAGFTFAGWNTRAPGTGTAYANGAVFPFSSTLTLYARWKALPTQYPVNGCAPVAPGSSARTARGSVLVRSACRTNVGQRVGVRVSVATTTSGRVVAPRGDVRPFQVFCASGNRRLPAVSAGYGRGFVTCPKGALTVRTSVRLRLSITWYAPATSTVPAFRVSRTYRL